MASGRYRVVFVSPELALNPRGEFERLVWKSQLFIALLCTVIWDEGHCVSSWAGFREYKSAGRLRSIIPNTIPYLVPSATLPEPVREDVTSALRLRSGRTHLISMSNDRPNIYLTVRKIRHALSSFKDLEFLIPDGWKPGTSIPSFLIFFDSKAESIKAGEFLQQRLPREHRHRVVWFNSDGTSEFRKVTTAQFDEQEVYGLVCTDAFGMVSRLNLMCHWSVC